MSENKEILKTNEVSAPTLFVGVGGTGCKIVSKVADLWVAGNYLQTNKEKP